MKEEKKVQSQSTKEPIRQKTEGDGPISPNIVKSPGAQNGRRAMVFKPALPTMSATPDIVDDDGGGGDDDDDDDKKPLKIPEGLSF